MYALRPSSTADFLNCGRNESSPYFAGQASSRDRTNPAIGGTNPTIHIKTGLADLIKVRVFNEIGIEVHTATLAQFKIMGNALAYEHPIPGLPSGAYIYVVEATKNGHTLRDKGKVVIIK